jgi:uncharacterized protein
MTTNDVRDFAANECLKPGNLLSPAFFDQHILPVADFGRGLATQIGADCEIVEISAYLHDISAVQDIASMPVHNVDSARIAAELLTKGNYPPQSVERVQQCIRAHTVPLHLGEASLEEVCISNADAVAQIARLPYWLYFAFVVRKLGFSEGREWLRARVETNWNALIEPARRLIEKEYKLAHDCLN